MAEQYEFIAIRDLKGRFPSGAAPAQVSLQGIVTGAIEGIMPPGLTVILADVRSLEDEDTLAVMIEGAPSDSLRNQIMHMKRMGGLFYAEGLYSPAERQPFTLHRYDPCRPPMEEPSSSRF